MVTLKKSRQIVTNDFIYKIVQRFVTSTAYASNQNATPIITISQNYIQIYLLRKNGHYREITVRPSNCCVVYIRVLTL